MPLSPLEMGALLCLFEKDWLVFFNEEKGGEIILRRVALPLTGSVPEPMLGP